VTDRIEELEINLLLEALYQCFHYDFRDYSKASIRRRLRQLKERLGYRNFSAMLEGLLHDPMVFPQVVSYLTVQVSEMFRDPSYFRALREQVVPHLRTYPSLKVWVAGCSSG
jgi:chemotaxis protein methyltransferase CheR